MTNTVLALGLYASTGGPSRSVLAFQQALAARVISWVDPVRIAREPQVWGSTPCHLVRGRRELVLRQILYPAAADLAGAEEIVAHSRLVSCHSFWRWHNVWLQKTARQHRVPYWFVPHGALDPYVLGTKALVKNLFLRAGGRRFLDEAAGVVCATRREHEKLAPVMPSTPHAVIPWPLADADFTAGDETQRRDIRRHLGVDDTDTLLISLGRLHPMKRPLESIRALAESGRSDVHLVLVGNEDGVTVRACKAAAVKHGVRDRVHVVGPVFGERKRAFLIAADAYVSLSIRENFNFTCAEAMAAALPVILSPGNDLAAELVGEHCGWMLADDRDAPGAIASAAQGGAAARKKAGDRGRAWAMRNLRFEDFADRVRRFAAQVTGGA